MVKCLLCRSNENDPLRYGEFIERNGIGVHLFCLYLTTNLPQRGKDEEGIFGFLINDIKKEIQRISHLKCWYCRKRYANIICCYKKCSRKFHFGCGLEKNAENRFIGQYESFCHSHARKDNKKPKDSEICRICFDNLIPPNETFNRMTMIFAPCCRNGWFHKYCLQNFANHSGYYFKCPLCNNEKNFRYHLSNRGIFIPEKDASWELEPNAFEELLERPKQCVAKNCKKRSSQKNFKLCSTCGSVAIHIECLPKHTSNFQCDTCLPIISNLSLLVYSDEDEDVDIDECSSVTNDTTMAKDHQIYENPHSSAKNEYVETYSSDDSDDEIKVTICRKKTFKILDDSSSEDSSEDESPQINWRNIINLKSKNKIKFWKKMTSLNYESSDSSSTEIVKETKNIEIKKSGNNLLNQILNGENSNDGSITSNDYSLQRGIDDKSELNVQLEANGECETESQENSDEDPLENFFSNCQTHYKGNINPIRKMSEKDNYENEYVLHSSKVNQIECAHESRGCFSYNEPTSNKNFINSIPKVVIVRLEESDNEQIKSKIFHDIHLNSENSEETANKIVNVLNEKNKSQSTYDSASKARRELEESENKEHKREISCIAKRTRRSLKLRPLRNHKDIDGQVSESLNCKPQRCSSEIRNETKYLEPRVKLRRLSSITNSNINHIFKNHEAKENNGNRKLTETKDDVKLNTDSQKEQKMDTSCIAHRTRRKSMYN